MADLIDGRRLEYVGGVSDKFWEWRLYEDDAGASTKTTYSLTFTWGRRGTRGQSMLERFTDKGLALWKARARERLKFSRGYVVAGAYSPLEGAARPQRVTGARASMGPPPPKPPKPEPAPKRPVRLIKLRD